MSNLWESEDNIFEILHEYYLKLDRFAEDLDRATGMGGPGLVARARRLADAIERYEAAFEAVLYPRLDDCAHPARVSGLAVVHTGNLVELLRGPLSTSRAALLRRSIDGYLQRVHGPIVSAAKMRFARETALMVGRAVREAVGGATITAIRPRSTKAKATLVR